MNDDLELCWGTGMSKQAKFHTCLFHFGLISEEKLFFHVCESGLSVTQFFVRRWSCDMWLLVVWVLLCRSVFDTWGGRRTDWFLGCCAALASWLLRLLLSFDYQNPCLLFLKLQVQDQNDYFGKLSEAYFQNSSHLCSWNFMLNCLDLSNQVLCADSVYLGFPFYLWFGYM
jgi:hypothetical protein